MARSRPSPDLGSAILGPERALTRRPRAQLFTRVGYGDTAAATHGERAVSAMLALAAVPLAAYILSLFREMRSGGFSTHERFMLARRARLEYLSDRGLPPAAATKIAKLLDHTWSQVLRVPTLIVPMILS